MFPSVRFYSLLSLVTSLILALFLSVDVRAITISDADPANTRSSYLTVPEAAAQAAALPRTSGRAAKGQPGNTQRFPTKLRSVDLGNTGNIASVGDQSSTAVEVEYKSGSNSELDVDGITINGSYPVTVFMPANLDGTNYCSKVIAKPVNTPDFYIPLKTVNEWKSFIDARGYGSYGCVCLPGRADCDGLCNTANGCETDITQAANCGACNVTCGSGQACVATGSTWVCQDTATCTDNIQNSAETGVDCGGTCPACARCGDRVVNIGEQCDFGDADPGDGCSSSCLWEIRTVSCALPGGNSTALQLNSPATITQMYGAFGWGPPEVAVYNAAALPSMCTYSCNSANGYFFNGTACVNCSSLTVSFVNKDVIPPGSPVAQYAKVDIRVTNNALTTFTGRRANLIMKEPPVMTTENTDRLPYYTVLTSNNSTSQTNSVVSTGGIYRDAGREYPYYNIAIPTLASGDSATIVIPDLRFFKKAGNFISLESVLQAELNCGAGAFYPVHAPLQCPVPPAGTGWTPAVIDTRYWGPAGTGYYEQVCAAASPDGVVCPGDVWVPAVTSADYVGSSPNNGKCLFRCPTNQRWNSGTATCINVTICTAFQCKSPVDGSCVGGQGAPAPQANCPALPAGEEYWPSSWSRCTTSYPADPETGFCKPLRPCPKVYSDTDSLYSCAYHCSAGYALSNGHCCPTGKVWNPASSSCQ
ncbi:MAG: hypothetical protein HQL20_06645 [Candidatus Omnitrophica bacterium]|nr:hypothetical protein [Candidatus Omnitrophota bacterium]